MSKSIVFTIILLTAALAAFAGPKPQKFEVSISAPTTVAGVELKAGTYQAVVSADGAVVTFYQDSAEVAKAAVHTQTSDHKNDYTVLGRADQVLKQIQVAGTKTTVVIDGPAKAVAAGGTR